MNASTGVPGTFAYTPASGAILAVGTQTLSVTFTPTDTVNYNSARTTVSLTVNKAALSVTTQAASKTYGAANPAFSATYGGFVNGDGPGSLGGTLVFATSATTSSTGGYNVTPSGLTSANYAISYVAGSLTVNQAPLTIAAQDKSRTFGAANPTFTVSYSGFVLGQSSASLGGTLSCATTAVAAKACRAAIRSPAPADFDQLRDQLRRRDAGRLPSRRPSPSRR
ncbi:MAG: MBG domain-containing protein [Chloroflexia bacterium]